jgi:hypothetical protein
MPLVLVSFSSKRFGICKRPIWGVNNKGWEIRVRVRVRVRVLGGVELILLWESDVGNVGEDDDGRASGHRAVCKRIRVLTQTLDDNPR